MLPLPEPSAKRATPTPPSLIRRMRVELPQLSLGALCLVGSNALGLAIPRNLQHAVDALAATKPGVLDLVARAALLIVALAAMQAAFRTASRVLIFNAGRNIEYRLRRDLFGFLAAQPPAFYARHPVGDLMSRLTNDLGAVRMLFGPGVLNLVNTAIVYVSGIWLLLDLSPRLTAVALLPFPLVFLFGRLSSRRLFQQSRALQEQLGTLSTSLQEDLTGIATVRAYTLESRRRAQFDRLNQGYFDRQLALVRARGALTPLFALIGGLGTWIVLWLGGHEVTSGRLTVGQLVAFNAYLVFLSWPTVALGWVLSLWQRGTAAWARVRELLDHGTAHALQAPPALPVPEARAAYPNGVTLRVTNLTVEHGSARRLDGVSFTLAPGRTLAVVGRTGCGKSTLADALAGFVEVPRGTIFFDERDARDLPAAEIRGAIAYAPQDAFLFSATLAENIAFGRPTASDAAPDASAMAEIRAAALAAGLARDVAAFPDGHETLVGERGITLSGGQRQRVALARALHARRPILLLDDSLSAVDAETEQDILGHLRPLLGAQPDAGETARPAVIIVSHRVAAVRHADEILVLDGGRAAERGTHAELVAKNGLYAEIYREQFASDPVASVATAPYQEVQP